MNDLAVHVSEHQEMNFIEEFKAVQARDSICNGRLFPVTILPTRILNFGSVRNAYRACGKKKNHQGVSGDVINDPFVSINNLSRFLEEFLIQPKNAMYGDPVQPT